MVFSSSLERYIPKRIFHPERTVSKERKASCFSSFSWNKGIYGNNCLQKRKQKAPLSHTGQGCDMHGSTLIFHSNPKQILSLNARGRQGISAPRLGSGLPFASGQARTNRLLSLPSDKCTLSVIAFVLDIIAPSRAFVKIFLCFSSFLQKGSEKIS